VKDLAWSDLGQWTFLNDAFQDLVGVDGRQPVERSILTHGLKAWDRHNWSTRMQGEGRLGNSLVDWLLPVAIEGRSGENRVFLRV